ncbi:MAG: DUF2510 domain-containing protein [Acidimicrobiales bacterium]
MSSPPAGWFKDPAGSDSQRYWDGTAWTDHYIPVDPPPPDPPGPAPEPVTADADLSAGTLSSEGQSWAALWKAPTGPPPAAPPPVQAPPPMPERPAPPSPRPMRPPRGYSWYIRYVIGMVVVYLCLTAWALFQLNSEPGLTPLEADPLRFQATLILFVGPALCVLFLFGLFIPKRPWGWIYSLLLICWGMTNICAWPITIPLLLKWITPEMKAYFKRPSQI